MPPERPCIYKNVQLQHRSDGIDAGPQTESERRFSLSGRWWRPFCRAGGADVVHVDLKPHPERERAAFRLLNEAERGRWRSFRLDAPRSEFALCRAALRALLCRRLDCANSELTFEDGEHGKPEACVNGQPASIRFNVSHSRRHGLIALAASGRLGVDVEPRSARRNLDALMEEALTPAEQARLARAGEQRRRQLFYRLWTMKEALVKALGTGFQLHVSEFEIPAPMCDGQRLCEFRFPHLPEVRWRLENIGTPQFAAAIAHEIAPDGEAV